MAEEELARASASTFAIELEEERLRIARGWERSEVGGGYAGGCEVGCDGNKV